MNYIILSESEATKLEWQLEALENNWQSRPTSRVLGRVSICGLGLISQQQFDPSTLLPSMLSYYGYDGHGNVRFLMDTDGNLTDTYMYDAFGNLLNQTGNTPNNYLYCGQYWDSDLGLYYNRARYMAPSIERFMTTDGDYGNNEDPLSLHKYLYAEDNPVDNDDPSGNASELGLILSPISSLLYTGPSSQPLNANELNFISGLGVFAPPELVDVYTWRTSPWKLVTHSAGHVMMTLHDVTTGYPLLSQWPCAEPNPKDGEYGWISDGKGYNTLWNFKKTTDKENVPPSHIFEVSIPGTEVSTFNTAIATQLAMPFWDSIPNGVNETQCSTAVCYALEQARILPPTTWISGTLWPSTFDTDMMNEAKWPGTGVTLIATDALLSSMGN